MTSLSRRIAMILSGALLLIALGTIGIYRFQQVGEGDFATHLPLPVQSAAMALMIERTPPDQLPVLLRALNSVVVQVRVDDQRPLGGSKDEPGLDTLASLIRRELEADGGRSVQVFVLPESDQAAHEDWIRIVIGLRDGRFLTIERRSGPLRYLFSGRLIGAALSSLLLVGLLAMWLMRRQLRPLEELVIAIERFGENLEAPPLRAHGAAELRRLVAAFNQMRRRIRALIEARTRLLAAISHDLGTYLTRLRLRVEFIDDESQRQRAIRDVEDMDALIKDSLALGRQDAGEEPAVALDLTGFIQAQIDEFAEQGMEVRLVEALPLRARARPLALKRVLNNLIDNALKHAGQAEISLGRSADHRSLELRIEDRGPGIPAELRELVVEPFYRRDDSRNLDGALNGAGFGLGLAIVSDLLRRYRGTLAFEDRSGGGLSVRIELGSLAVPL